MLEDIAQIPREMGRKRDYVPNRETGCCKINVKVIRSYSKKCVQV